MATHLRLVETTVVTRAPRTAADDRPDDPSLAREITAQLVAHHRQAEDLLVELDKGDPTVATDSLTALRRHLAGERCIADQILLPLVRAHAPGLSSRFTSELARLHRLEALLPARADDTPGFRRQANDACAQFETSLANLDDLLAELEAQVPRVLLCEAGQSARALASVRATAGLRLV